MTDAKPIRIAYADDHIAVRKGIITLLEASGRIKVDIDASDGQELIGKLAAADCLPHVCLVDIRMPVLNGFDTVAQIKELWPAIKVLAFTMYEEELYVIRMIKNGAGGYVLKTCNTQELIAAIESIAEKGYHFSEPLSSKLYNAIKNKQIKLPQFTEQEVEVLKFCCTDLTYKEIADRMNTTNRSVEGHRDSLFKKLGISSRVSLVLFAIQFGYHQLNDPTL